MSDEATISCKGCDRTFQWQPKFAGKRVKCKCGELIEISSKKPERPDTLKQPDEPPKRPCPSCGAPMRATARICVKCGYDFETKKKNSIMVGAGPTLDEATDPNELGDLIAKAGPLRELNLPMSIIGILMIMFSIGGFTYPHTKSWEWLPLIGMLVIGVLMIVYRLFSTFEIHARDMGVIVYIRKKPRIIRWDDIKLFVVQETYAHRLAEMELMCKIVMHRGRTIEFNSKLPGNPHGVIDMIKNNAERSRLVRWNPHA